MKKIIGFLTLTLLFSVHINAQGYNQRAQQRTNYSAEQKAELQVKRMALNLDLNESQQKAILELKLKQAKELEQKRAEFRAQKQNGTKISSDERFRNKQDRLDRQIATKAEMKKILNKEQFSKWEKFSKTQRFRTAKKFNNKANRSNKKTTSFRKHKNRF
ncbi:hypothetical protein ACFQZW_01875 [Lutibacter aestuarii]|uniref:DUF4890 domain-containing protein n=1 Tax=Lutibacter aestuarii TaxID=861111 RepID=A0ABW2Z3W5_9FLAO|nr:hypothetical protein [uncultured Lutibacter sp.]